jgi:cell division protein ZipA
LDYDRFYMSEADNDIFFKTHIEKESLSSSDAGSGGCSTAASTAEEPMFVSAEQPVPQAEEPAPQAIELPAGVEPMLINLTVMAPQDMTFDPHYLRQTLDDSGMSLGDMNIYHYYRRPKSGLEPNRGQRLFSIASMVEPGYFDPQNIDTYRTPGLVLFMQLPGPIDGVLAFEKMHQMGETLAKRLSGTLCDDKHNKITPQSITHTKDEISEYNLKLRSKLGRTIH